MEQAKRKDKNILSSLNRALKVLDLVSVRPGLGVSEIARSTGYDKASIYKMLYTLEHRSYIEKTEDARYYVSEKLAHRQDKGATNKDIIEVSIPYMQRLRDECRESVYLGVLNTNGRVIFLHMEAGLKADSINTRIGYEIDAYSTSTGKILLANLDDAMQASIVSRLSFRALTPTTVTSAAVLQAELDMLRGEIYAEEFGENYPGHSDGASPIFDEDGRCLAAISIVCPVHSLEQDNKRFRVMLIRTAKLISQKMGYQAVSPF